MKISSNGRFPRNGRSSGKEPVLSLSPQTMEAAFQLLEPEQDDACRSKIKLVLFSLAYFDHQDRLDAAPSKASKASARRLAAALRRAQRELKNDALNVAGKEELLRAVPECINSC